MSTAFLPAVLALIFYAVEPILGVIVALVVPSVVALDSNGDYAEVIVFVMLALALHFVRKAMTEVEVKE